MLPQVLRRVQGGEGDEGLQVHRGDRDVGARGRGGPQHTDLKH